MIDLTPLDVRNKRGDFKKLMRGYDPQEVDVFLEIVAERLEALTRENMALKERSGALQAQVNSQTDREQAVQAALVTAQELRADIRAQAQREAENVVKAAETEGRRLVAEAEAEARTKLRDAERQFDKLEDAIQMLDRRRSRFLNEFRQLLQREMDVVAVEDGRKPLEERTIDLELGPRRTEEAPMADGRAVPAQPTPLPQAPAAPPSPATAQRQDNFLLYLDADADDASR
jgi:DivIVA domain-containing protein